MGKFRKSALMLMVLSLVMALAVTTAPAAEKVIVFHAGSLSAPMAEIEKLYEGANPGSTSSGRSGAVRPLPGRSPTWEAPATFSCRRTTW